MVSEIECQDFTYRQPVSVSLFVHFAWGLGFEISCGFHSGDKFATLSPTSGNSSAFKFKLFAKAGNSPVMLETCSRKHFFLKGPDVGEIMSTVFTANTRLHPGKCV